MLSVVIPTYNEEEYLPRLLSSIREQDFAELEIIVADANSTDRTRELAIGYGATVVQGGLPSAGRNRGAAAARGETVLFLDADVALPDPAFLTRTIGEFRRRGLGVATCQVQPMSPRALDKVLHGIYNSYMVAMQDVAPHAPGFCIFVKKEVHDAVRGFDEAIRLAEDHDYVSRAAKVGAFAVLTAARIPVSVRRLDRDGRLNLFVKYLLCELHLRTLGKVTSDVFRYRFGYEKKNK